MMEAKIKNFAPSEDGILLEEDGKENWKTVVGGAASFAKNLEKGDKVEYKTGKDGNVNFIRKLGTGTEEKANNTKKSKSSSKSSKTQLDRIEEKLDKMLEKVY